MSGSCRRTDGLTIFVYRSKGPRLSISVSVRSRRRWTLSVPRTRLTVRDGRSVSIPSALLRPPKARSKNHLMMFGGAEVELEDRSAHRNRSTQLFISSLEVWLGGLICPKRVFSYISNLEWGSGTEKMRCIFSLIWKKLFIPKQWHGALCDTNSTLRNFFLSF